MNTRKMLLGVVLIALSWATLVAGAQTTTPIEVEYSASQSYQTSWTTGNFSYQPQSWDQLSLINTDTTNPNSVASIYFQTGNATGEATGRMVLVQEGTYQSAFVFQTRNNNSPNAQSEVMRISGSGKVGIGTTAPTNTLEVNGTAQVDGTLVGSNNGAVVTGGNGIHFSADPVGTNQTTAWTGVLCGGDYAEAMNVAGSKAKYQPGDVLVLASGDSDDVQKSAEPYSTMVAGIYATKPGVIGRRQALAKSTNDIPMAMVGVVPTKVSAENGPIHKGDLLVTSSVPGYAMKGTDRSRMLGAVIGKAMQPMESGQGVIEVLVTLQ